jgi:hypothetical protein
MSRTPVRFRFMYIALTLFASLSLAQPLWAQQQGQLFISVLDTAGKPVTDLTAADFEVTADTIDCKVVKVEPFSKPTRLSIMIDNGPATTKELANFRAAYKSLLQAVPEGIETELITIAPQPRWLEKPTTDRQKLIQAIDRLAPDSGAGLFFDALVEGGNRVDKDKGSYFPVFLILASDFGRNSSSMDRDFMKLQKQILQYGITVDFVMFHSGGDRLGSVGGAIQTEVGLGLTKLSGGRYENINSSTRLMTLLPELAQQIGRSNIRQLSQYRVTYERPGKDSKPVQQVGAALKTSRVGLLPQLSLDGHMPAPAP